MKRELYVSEEFKKKFVSEIKCVLRITGITINSYASELGVSRQTVSKMLNDTDYNIKIVYAIASMEVLWTMVGKTRMPFNNRSFALSILSNLINAYWHREPIDTSECFRDRREYLDSYTRKKNTPDNEGAKTPRKEKEL